MYPIVGFIPICFVRQFSVVNNDTLNASHRFPYYALRLFDEEIGLITYLRYTLWIPLYPIGFMCEGTAL